MAKPHSIPVHPCGAYHHNSLIKILENDEGLRGLRPIFRLDRLTGGIVILAKDNNTARQYTEMLKQPATKKCYVAKVKGKFPAGIIQLSIGVSCKCKKDGVY